MGRVGVGGGTEAVMEDPSEKPVEVGGRLKGALEKLAVRHGAAPGRVALCGRASSPPVVFNCVKGACRACAREVWVAPSLQRAPEPKTLFCSVCVAAELRAGV